MFSNSSEIIASSGLDTPLISVDGNEARAILLRHFGLAGTMARLDTEKDDTFRVTTDDSVQWIAKFSNPGESDEDVEFQVGLLDHVARVDDRLSVPRVRPTRDGRPYQTIVDSHGQRRTVRVLSFLDGVPMDSVEVLPREMEQVGEVLAQLRLATAEFSHPGDSRVLAWDVQHIQRLDFMVDAIESESHRSSVRAALSRLAELGPEIAALPTQVLHNDFSRSNIVVRPGSNEYVAGIIDFGDAVRTAIAIDVSTALMNQFPERVTLSDDIFADGRFLIRGYLHHAGLTDKELALVPHLAMARVAARALITTWRSARMPENTEYVMRNTARGWAQLDWFLSRTTDQVTDTFIHAVRATERNASR